MSAAPKITVVVPTYNRSRLLRLALESILAQDFDDFGVIVLDNASTDDTPQMVESLAREHPRLKLVRNPQNIGLQRNWNRAFDINPSPYISVFHDDDVMLPGCLRETVAVLDKHPSVGFVLVRVEYIDEHGNLIEAQDVGDLRPGLMAGLDLLELAVDGRHQGIYPPNIVFRASAAQEAGPLESPHTNCQFDLNFYNRIAARHDVFFINKILARYRLHIGSETERQKSVVTGTTWYGEAAERIDAIGFLLDSPRGNDPDYRRWLAQRLQHLHRQQSSAIHPSIPAMYFSWEQRMDRMSDQLQRLIPGGDTFILIDDGQLGVAADWEGRTVLPFLEKDGSYWGPPESDDQAIADLDRLRSKGAKWLVFSWPSFWWIDKYWRFYRDVCGRFHRRMSTPDFEAFDLSSST